MEIDLWGIISCNLLLTSIVLGYMYPETGVTTGIPTNSACAANSMAENCDLSLNGLGLKTWIWSTGHEQLFDLLLHPDNVCIVIKQKTC